MIKALITLIVLVGSLGAHASELGSNVSAPQSQINWQRQSQWQSQSPRLTDPNQSSRQAASGTLREKNTGVDSLIVAARTASDAAKICDKGHWDKQTKACANTYFTTKFKDRPITNLTGCKVLKSHVNASCYGLADGFAGGSTLLGPFKPSLQTAAYPFKKDKAGKCTDGMLGSVVVVVYQGVGHAVTITDWGPAFKLQPGTKANRGIDLSRGSFESFGNRLGKDMKCAVDGVLKDVQILQCPMTGSVAAN